MDLMTAGKALLSTWMELVEEWDNKEDSKVDSGSLNCLGDGDEAGCDVTDWGASTCDCDESGDESGNESSADKNSTDESSVTRVKKGGKKGSWGRRERMEREERRKIRRQRGRRRRCSQVSMLTH